MTARAFVIVLAGFLLVGGLLINAPQPQAAAEPAWPGVESLWRGTEPVTQTPAYRGLSVVGNDYLYVLYDTGYASATGTLALTVTRQWRGIVFETLTATGTISTSQRGTGAITVASASPYYPDIIVGLSTSAGTMTPTVAVVGQ